MNPSSNERNGINLPPPVGEQIQSANEPTESVQNNSETNKIVSENDPTKPATQGIQMPSFPQITNTNSQSQVSNNDVANTINTNAPVTADDGDLIEKEWVNKAKQIVEHNREDPYQQSKELTLFKADYMQKRYNKTIKLGE